MKYASIVVDITSEKLDRAFQYRIPSQWEQELEVGMVVTVPFGKGDREINGYVVELTDTPQFDVEKLKCIRSIKSDAKTTESSLIVLAKWMREHYGSTMIQALKTVFPVKAKVQQCQRRTLVLQLSAEEAKLQLKELERKNYRARARLLSALMEHGSLDGVRAAKELGAVSSVVKSMEEAGWIRVECENVYRDPVRSEKIQKLPPAKLTGEQRKVLDGIIQEWEGKSRPCLIHGVTGSGKTEVYMELIDRTLKQGKQAIILIPEIALTYQTVMRFYGRFGEVMSVLHSRLSQGERYDQFCRAKEGKVQIMVGPRSALFTPFPKLGLIVIDEEHENTYKSEITPRYHAREAAIWRAWKEQAHVVMGSATPSLEVYERCMREEYALFEMNNRYGERPLPGVSIIDLRRELREGNRSILSRELQKAMEVRLEKKEQVILFLNRRGYAGFLSCRSCGQVIQCPHCDVSLCAHKGGKLVCHYCGYETEAVKKCPSCGSPYIGAFRAGTQQIQEIVQKQYPNSRVLRMDYDTTKGKEGHGEILEAFSRREADILIGTQMIVKGHDFPNVTLVGVLAADLSLHGDDYRCAERTFQLLTQAVGRAGRGEKPGEALIQTYQPEHYSIQAAARQDYRRFYEEEMGYRTLLGYPPAEHMMAVLGSCQEEERLNQAMEYLKRFIQRVYTKKDLRVIGPAPQSVGRVKDQYKKVIYLKHAREDVLIYVRDKLEQYMEINSGFHSMTIQFDIQ